MLMLFKQMSQSVKSVIINFLMNNSDVFCNIVITLLLMFTCCDDYEKLRQEFVTSALAVIAELCLFCLDCCNSHSDM